MKKKPSYWIIPAVEIKQASIDEIVNKVCNHFGVTMHQLKSKVRLRTFVDARSIIAYLLSKSSISITQEKIGLLLNRDHSSIAYYKTKVAGFTDVNREYRELVNSFL